MNKAMTIPNAKNGVDKKWKALGDVPAWDLSRVRPEADVIAEAKCRKQMFMFGFLWMHATTNIRN